MKAFLSHSSADKGYVERVAKLLRPGTFELDSLTFEKGEMNIAEIISALKRVDLFCLFMSNNAALSKYVEFEQSLALELVGAGKINNFLTICLDNFSFEKLSADAKFFNAIRQPPSPETAAHIINGKLISASKLSDKLGHPFIGREHELKELEAQVLDFSKPKVKAFFLSGNSGVGRRSIAEQFLARQYPQVLRSYPILDIEQYAGFDEIYRQVVAALNPSLDIREFISRATEFSQKSDSEKAQAIAAEINGMLENNIVVFANDVGGLLHESGALSSEFEQIMDYVQDYPHPPLF